MERSMDSTPHPLAALLGLGGGKTSHAEKLVAGLGGFTGILLTLLVTQHFVPGPGAALIVASMGASAVLLFAVPHGQLSQPWALIGGHLISAFIGVGCQILIHDRVVAAACAVGLAILAMYYLQCVHPPGGATALSAVIGGPAVHALGFHYVATPVMLNVLVIFSVGLLFNFAFPWRRYPAALSQYLPRRGGRADDAPAEQEPALSHEDFAYALQRMNMYVDISEDDLRRIYSLARDHTRAASRPEQIQVGRYYSNGEYGDGWSVRRVIDESDVRGGGRDQVIYRVVAGKDRRASGTLEREQFTRWAKYEVYRNGDAWYRVPAVPAAAEEGAC